MDPESAQALTEAARLGVESVRKIGLVGWREHVHETLGLPDFETWARSTFQGIKISRDERREIAQEMHGEGATQREIAAVTGVDHRTVGRDLGANAPVAVRDLPKEVESDELPGANAPGPAELQAEVEALPEVKAAEFAAQFGRWAKIALAIPQNASVDRAVEVAAIRPVFRDRWLQPLIEQLKPWLEEVERRTSDQDRIRRVK